MARMRNALALLAGVLIGAAIASQAMAEEAPAKIRIGYSVALTGPYALGASSTTTPNYKLWAATVNKDGGIMLKKFGKKVPVELIEYDDKSSLETAVQNTQKLILEDKVDFLLAPWGTAVHLAVAPIFNKYHYPLLGVTAGSEKIVEFAKARKWPYAFWLLAQPQDATKGIVEMLSGLRKAGKLNGNVAIMNVMDQSGIEYSTWAQQYLTDAGFNVVYFKSYPLGVADLSDQIREVMKLDADSFLAFSYPPDTFMITGEAITLKFNPKVMYFMVGSNFPQYRQTFGPKVEGIMALSGWDPKVPGAQEYFKAHTDMFKQEPDRGGSPLVYASLEVLQDAIEQVGDLNREKVSQVLASGKTFKTMYGPISFKDGLAVHPNTVGQWSNGQFAFIEPASKPGAMPIVFPKPAW